jgi:hypothetical protein
MIPAELELERAVIPRRPNLKGQSFPEART